MKKLIYIIIVVFFSSCENFLEESSQDLIIPKTVKDYSEFLFGEGYIRDNTSIHTYLDIMTDDVEEKANTWPIMQSDIRGDGIFYFFSLYFYSTFILFSIFYTIDYNLI